MSQVPTSTQWTRDAVGEAGRQAVDSVYLVQGQNRESQGTGVLLDNGFIITNQHVIEGNSPNEIIAHSASGEEFTFTNIVTDAKRDLAALEPEINLSDGLQLELSKSIKPGTQVSTWGYPIGYAGPAPLLSVGYLAGFHQEMTPQGPVKQLVVNGAFNNGNSGGPLFISGERRVIGIVVTKHVPLTEEQIWILNFFEQRNDGMGWDLEQQDGTTERVTLTQMVAEYLTQYQQLTQLMIGHAIDAMEIAEFLKENDLPTPKE